MRSITPADILTVMRKAEESGIAFTANRIRQVASRVFQHALRNLRAEYDPAQSLKGAVVVPGPSHYAALGARELPAFLDALDAYPGSPITRLALRLLLFTMVRKSELLGATWEEVDFEASEWRIPAERMKMRSQHIVPLSAQALECFKELHRLACGSRYVLPNYGSLDKPMGHSTLNRVFERMGYIGRFTVHGMRATASTILNEHGFRPDVIERQLAHTERNKVRAAYNRAEYLEERRKMLQHWANYLDALRTGAQVVPIRAA